MKCVRKYTIVEYEYKSELEARLHAKTMRGCGYTKVNLTSDELSQPKGNISKAYKFIHTEETFF